MTLVGGERSPYWLVNLPVSCIKRRVCLMHLGSLRRAPICLALLPTACWRRWQGASYRGQNINKCHRRFMMVGADITVWVVDFG